ncbi:MAG TPA: HAD-IIIC family phosphatase, partial [Gammaproteobacteria bacterium]
MNTIAAPNLRPQCSNADVAGGWFERAEWHPALLAPLPRRLELMKLRPSWPCAPFHLRVHRNQAFEFVSSVLPPFLAYAARTAEITLSGYDDSLAFALDGPADVELVWIDLGRYRDRMDAPAIGAWIGERLAELRRRTAAPILVADDPRQDATAADVNAALRSIAPRVPGVRVFPLSETLAGLGSRALDARAAAIAGMPLSDAACLLAARALGLVWLPAALGPRLKAIVLDLDHTLYAGVLGEDGPEALQLTPAHELLQRKLLALRDEGLFLAIASRNVEADVDRLFEVRRDMPLHAEHLSARSIAFREKATGLREICAALRIAPDALLFIDDNPGEIARVVSELPGIKILHAADAEITARALGLYPGLHGYPKGKDDALRVADLAANALREQVASSAANPEEYLRSLKIALTFATNRVDQRIRMAELSNKTNQFNTGFLRLSEAEVARRFADPECRSICVWLRDRLSDSGVVGSFFFRREGTTLRVEEVAISCRALGRGIEHVMVTEAVRRALLDLPALQVHFELREGPRNAPAREFLAEYVERPVGPHGVTMTWDDSRAASILARYPV